MALWNIGIMALWHCGIMALWHWCIMALVHYGIGALWHCGIMALWHYGIVALWHCGIMALFHYGTLAKVATSSELPNGDPKMRRCSSMASWSQCYKTLLSSLMLRRNKLECLSFESILRLV
jgi:hypothetical protein